MPLVTPIILTDGITPVTLNPVGRVANKSSFLSTHKANLDVQAVLDVTVNDNKTSQRNIVKLSEPLDFVDADTGLTTHVDTAIGEINLRIPRSMTPVQRTLFVKQLFSAVDNATLSSVCVDGENFWS